MMTETEFRRLPAADKFKMVEALGSRVEELEGELVKALAEIDALKATKPVATARPANPGTPEARKAAAKAAWEAKYGRALPEPSYHR